MSWETSQEPKIFIAIPHTGTVSMEWALSLRQLKTPTYLMSMSRGTPWDVARNTLVNEFLKGTTPYLFFLDSDVIIPAHGINKLLSLELPVVSGLYFTKTPPQPVPAMWQKTDETGKYVSIQGYAKNETVEADVVGMGCCLIHRRVFEKLKEINPEKPFYKWTFDPTKSDVGEGISEDFYFCERVKKEIGYKIFVDTSIECKHVGQFDTGSNGIEFQDV